MQQLKSGSLLQGGKYKIEKVLGQGGFGITYLATQELLDRKVCIKEFFYKEYCERNEATSHVSLGTQSSHEIVERFMNKFLKEARTISQLDHRNVIKIHDIFKENNTAYYVMDYVEGESLNDMVNRRGALSEKEAVAYIQRVADALKYIHQQNINHLDIKPSNIMIRQGDYRVILIDFGLSKQYDAQGGQTSTTPVGISHGYAPMEQYKQGGVSTFSPQTDIYALGATFYKLVTGNTPPQAMDILDDGLPDFPSSLSSSVVETIKKAMQPRKVDRPNCVEEFLNGLNVSSQNESFAQEIKTQHNVYIDEETKVLSDKIIKTEEKKGSTVENPQPNVILNSEEINVSKESESGKQRFKYILYLILSCLIIILLSKTCEGDNSSSIENNQSLTAQELFEKGMAYYEKEDYANAMPLIEKAANMGDIEAQSQLGVSFYRGEGVENDFVKAFKWSMKAAKKGHPISQFNIGLCYYTGQGITQNYDNAFVWFKESANQGLDVAQYALSACYHAGFGVEQSFSNAFYWCKKAAEQGDANAQCQLAIYYGIGPWNKDIERNEAKELEWYIKAADQRHPQAQCNLGIKYEYGAYGIEKNLKKAAELFELSAKQGYPNALRCLAECYYYGRGVTKDISKAKKLLNEALIHADDTLKDTINTLLNEWY